MAVTWARAEIEVDIDGSGVPRKVRMLAESAASDGGKAFNKKFDDELAKWDGKGFNSALKKFFKGDANDMNQWFTGLRDHIKKTNKSMDEHESAWKRLSHNTRQWTLIIGSVIAALPQLASLSSAAGAGLFVLAGALSGVITGAVFAGVAFAKFMGDLEKVPSELRESRRAFDDFKKTFTEVMDEMTTHAFKDTVDEWQKFGQVVKDLQPGFNAIGDVINGLIEDLAVNLDPGVVEDLNAFLEGSARILDRVVRAAGRLGKALLNAFNSPAFQHALEGFLGWIDLIIDRFSRFLEGPGFEEWLRHGEDVFGAFGDLLDTTGRLLNDLVTDETIGQLVAFIENIDRFLQTGGKGILDFAQELDVFGLLADALATFGDALEPLAGPLKDLAEGFHDVVESNIDTLAPIIEAIAEALAPFVQAIADFMKENPKAVGDTLLLIAGGFAALRAVKIGTLAVDMLLFSDAIGAGGKSIRKFDVGKLKKIGGGLAGIALVAAGQLIPDSFWEQFDIESNLPQNVLTGAGFGLMFGGWGAAIGAGIGLIVSLFTDFEATFNDIGIGLTAAILGGPMGGVNSALSQWFADLVPEEWRTSDNPMKQAMALLAEAVQDPGTFITELPTMFNTMWADIETGVNTFGAVWDGFWASIPVKWEAMWATLNNPQFWFAIADALGQWIAGLIDGFTQFLIDLAVGWTNFWNSLPTILAVAWLTIMATIQGWWNTIKSGFFTWFASLIGPWIGFWNSLPKSPESIGTQIIAAVIGWWNNIKNTFAGAYGAIISGWVGFWNGLVSTVRGVVNTIVGIVGRLFGPIQDALGRLGSLLSMGRSAGSGGGGAASGRLVFGPQNLLVGEAGPEAIVPLKRSLSRVNPSVRGLSAIAQGLAPAPGAAPGPASKVVNIAQGAIVIEGVLDPRAAAVGVVNRVAERFAG